MLPLFYRILLAVFSLLVCAPLLGQKAGNSLSLVDCGTTELNPQQRQALEAEAAFALRVKQATQGKATTITYVPIRPHIIRQSNGTGGYSLKRLNNVMALTNSYYLKNGVGIQFYFAGTTPDYVDNDALFAQFRIDIDEATIASRNVTNAMNQYYVQSFDEAGVGGYAEFPANNLAATQSFISTQGDDNDLGNRLVPHELGHNFNLIHTFEPFFGYELITRGAGANCATAGDRVCDTPADPYGRFPGASASCVSGCPATYTCGFTEPGTGAVYAPSPTNIMSYYFPCTYNFTPGQYDRLDAALALRQSHTAYSLTAVSTNVTPASNLTAIIANGLVLLNWTDNANNEMGYFIERSTTSANAGFVSIGGVAPNITTFTDARAPSFVQAYYRVRPSNSTGGISSVISLVTPACRPTYVNGCTEADGLNGFRFNGLTLSQNTGCASGLTGYSQYTVTSATVTAGQSYPFSGTLLSNEFKEGITIWADLNRNGLFSDAGEQLFQTPVTVTGSFSGSLTIPASTSAGTVAMRVMSVYEGIPNDPCGNYSYGETEDYRLTVTGGPICTAMTTTKVGNWNDPTVWSCNRVPVGTDAVLVGHLITVPTAITGRALKITYGAGGRLSVNSGGRVRLGP